MVLTVDWPTVHRTLALGMAIV